MSSHSRTRAGIPWRLGDIVIIVGMIVGAAFLVLYGTGHIL